MNKTNALDHQSQQEWANFVVQNPLAFERVVVSAAREYVIHLQACGRQSLAISSPEVDRALASGNRFWSCLTNKISPGQ
jgi:hypothetical protein